MTSNPVFSAYERARRGARELGRMDASVELSESAFAKINGKEDEIFYPAQSPDLTISRRKSGSL